MRKLQAPSGRWLDCHPWWERVRKPSWNWPGLLSCYLLGTCTARVSASSKEVVNPLRVLSKASIGSSIISPWNCELPNPGGGWSYRATAERCFEDRFAGIENVAVPKIKPYTGVRKYLPGQCFFMEFALSSSALFVLASCLATQNHAPTLRALLNRHQAWLGVWDEAVGTSISWPRRFLWV